MSDLWREVEAIEFGIPVIKTDCSKFFGKKMIAWIPGMRADLPDVDFYLICWHTGDLNRYLQAGGDSKKIIVHFLMFDEGAIDPLWGTDTFLKRVEKMESFGIENVISPDFSSWSDMAIATQINNIYKSAVVTHDLQQCGFNIIPNITFGVKKLQNIHFTVWDNSTKFALIDACHLNTVDNKENSRMFYEGLSCACEKFKFENFIVWISAKTDAAKILARFSNANIVFSRSHMLSLMAKQISKKRKEVKNG